jgi:geranylgeranyl diphosphate synthase, type I
MPLPDSLIEEIDRRIVRLMPVDGRSAPLYGMMKYHLGWLDEQLRPAHSNAGKRVRARLCLLCAGAVAGNPERAFAPATAVELLHNFSLIHDDIQDGSHYRRHRRTVWDIWGEAQAINAGDGMLVLSQLALAEDGEAAPAIVVRGLRALNRACQLLCEGQHLDLDYEQRSTVAVEDYYQMIGRKTAALLETSCFLGALYGGATEEQLVAYSLFGRQLGIAFQIRDDYLGIWGDPAQTGKSAATDVASKKKTLPLLYALGTAPEPDRTRLAEIMLSSGECPEDAIAEVLAILDRCGAASYAASEVKRISNEAIEALATARPRAEAGDELSALCRRMTIRTD